MASNIYHTKYLSRILGGKWELTFLGYLFLFVEREPVLLEYRYDFFFHGSLSLSLARVSQILSSAQPLLGERVAENGGKIVGLGEY